MTPDFSSGANHPSSAWDDWCGDNRRNINTLDQMPYFETVLRSSVRLVLASLERGSRQHVDTLDIGINPPSARDPVLHHSSPLRTVVTSESFAPHAAAFDLASPIYSFCRHENLEAHNKILNVRQQLLAMWHQGNGALKRLMR